MSDSEGPVCKRKKVENVSSGPNTPYSVSLLTFPDDLLLMIFALVNHEDLVSLSKTCERFNNVCYDKTLWEKVDVRHNVYTLNKLKRLTDFFQPNTKLFATKGPVNTLHSTDDPAITISKCFLQELSNSSPNLKTLIIENHVIDSSKLLLEDFPTSVECLGILNCDLRNLPTHKSYFYRLEKTLPNLKILDLSNNSWFNPHSLLALSKSTTLEQLTLTGCELGDCLPYASLAANFGFSALKILDLRKTCVSDIEVTCFNRTSSLRHLYLCASDPHLADAQVTDYSITTYGGGPREGRGPLNIDAEVIVFEVGSVPRPASKLETLVVNNYPGITDITLQHAAISMKYLKTLDVTGTGCSEAGILEFKKIRPEVQIIPDIMA